MAKGRIGTSMHVNRGHVILTPTFRKRQLLGQRKLAELKGDKERLQRINKELQEIHNFLTTPTKPKRINFTKKYGMFGWKARENDAGYNKGRE